MPENQTKSKILQNFSFFLVDNIKGMSQKMYLIRTFLTTINCMFYFFNSSISKLCDTMDL